MLVSPKIYYGITTHGAYREKRQPPIPPHEQPHNVEHNDVESTSTSFRRTNSVVVDNDNDTTTTDDTTLCHVVHAGNGTITILPTTDDDDDSATTMASIANVLQTSGLNYQFTTPTTNSNHDDNHDFTLLILWKKLAVNCIINPLTVIYYCRNGELLNDEIVPDFELRYLVPVCYEIAQLYVATIVMTHQQLLLQQRTAVVPEAAVDTNEAVDAATTTAAAANNNNNSTKRIMNGGSISSNNTVEQAKIEPIATMMREYVVQVIHNTAMNRSSTYEDVYNNNNHERNSSSRNHDNTTTATNNNNHNDEDVDIGIVPPVAVPTEIEYFNGYIVDKSKNYQLECPINQQILMEFYQKVSAAYPIR